MAYYPGSSQIDRNRFTPIRQEGVAPSQSKTWVDNTTGQEISRRQAINRSHGGVAGFPEKRIELRKELGIYKTNRTNVLERYLSKKGEAPRGAGKEKYNRVLQRLNADHPLNAKSAKGGHWARILHEEYDEPDFWDDMDWDAFYYPEETTGG